MLRRKLAECFVQAEVIMRSQRPQHLEVVDVTAIPPANGAFGQGQFRIDQALGIEILLNAQAITGRAGTGRVVEREQLGFQFADRMTANGAGKARRKNCLFAFLVVHGSDQRDTIRQLQRGLERLGQSLLKIGTHFETIDHHIDTVLFLLVQLGQLVQFVEFAVDAGADEALGAQLVEHRQVLTLALTDDRGQEHQLAAFRALQYEVDHLADRLRFQWYVMVWAAGCPGPGVQQAQVVVDLGDGADGGAGVV